MRSVIISGVSLLLMLFVVTCSNDGGESPQKKKLATIYTDLHVYKGSATGASKQEPIVGEDENKETVYEKLVRFTYFSKFNNELSKSNNISFEFLDGGMLSFVDMDNHYRIVSTYEFMGDKLYVLKNKDGVESPEFVAIRANDEQGEYYYRIQSVQKSIRYIGEEVAKTADENIEEGETGEVEPEYKYDPKDYEVKLELVTDKEKVLNLESVLEYAGIKDSVSMTNPKDSVVWCNVKYIYR